MKLDNTYFNESFVILCNKRLNGYTYAMAASVKDQKEFKYIKTEVTPEGHVSTFSIKEMTDLRDLLNEVLANN